MKIRTNFEGETITVNLDRLLPTRLVAPAIKDTAPYKAIVASIRELGVLVEDIVVFPQKGGKYLILDGHLRVEALRELGRTEVQCLVSTVYDCFTPNHRISRIAPIQASRMILKAMDAGVREARIASALDRSLSTVRGNRSLLFGICPEAVDLLKDKQVALDTLALMKKVKATRQIEIAEMMVAADNYTAPYARALVLTTVKELLVDPENPRRLPGVKPEDLAKMEHELRVLEKDFRLLDETYNENVMSLTIARGYLRELLKNGRVARYVGQRSKEVLSEFQRIVESAALDA